MKKIIIALVLIGAGFTNLFAQTSPNLFINSSVTNITTIPLYHANGGYSMQSVYTPGMFTGGPLSCGKITKIYIKTYYTGSTTLPDLKIGLGYTSGTTINGTASPANYLPVTTVANYASYTLNYTAGGWCEIPLQVPFDYLPGQNIVVDFQRGSAGSFTTQILYQYYINASSTFSSRYNYPGGAPAGQGYGITYQNVIGFEVIPTTPSTPVANFFVPPAVCKSSPVTLLNSFNAGCADTIQWTISPGSFSYVSGTSSTSKNPVVMFNDSINYTVKLRINNSTGRDSITKIVNVSNASVAPTPDFLADKTEVARGADFVNFTDLSSNCPQSWSWSSPNHPGGNPIINPTQKNPTGLFNVVGQFDICLAASNNIGTNNTCKSNYIKVLPSMVGCTDTLSRLASGYVFDQGGPTAPYANSLSANNCKGTLIDPCAATVTLQFESIKIHGSQDSIFIHNGSNANAPVIFTVGSNRNGTTPSVTASSGKMFIRFTSDGVGNDDGYRAKWTSTPGTYGKPTAVIAVPRAGGMGVDSFVSNFPIQLINNSTGVDMTYAWDLDGDGLSDAFTKNPTTSFAASTPVQKTVRLITSNCKGSDTTFKTVVIVPLTQKPTKVDFIASKLNIAPNDTVFFTDLSSFATSWEWTFTPANVVSFIGGTNKNSQNPIIMAAANGCITVLLKATNSFGNDIQLKVCYLTGKVYCLPASIYNTTTDVGISRVQLEQIDYTTPGGTASYTSYVDSALGKATLYKNQQYTLTLTRPSNQDTVSRKAWIDYNLDGDFEDAGELIASEVTKNLVSSFNFTVPASVQVGETVMRIGSSIGRSLLVPCAAQLGEFEDYKIVFDKDNIKPIISRNGGDTISIEVGSTYTDPGATAMDNLEGNITNKIVVTSDLDVSKVGFYSICYDVTDLYGNKADTKCRVVNVKVDLTPPTITVLGKTPDTIVVKTAYNDLGATASDNYSGNITNFIVKNSTLNVDSVGTYTITYTVADYFGYTASKTRTVVVIDNIKPTITPLKGTSFVHSVRQPLNNQLVVNVSDNYNTNLVATLSGTVNVNLIGDYNVTFNAADASGNDASPVSILIMVRDTTKPEIDLHGSATETIDVFANYVEPTATVSDNYDPTNKLTLSRTSGGFDKNKLGSYNITYTCTDSSGNKQETIRKVDVVDTKAPVIALKSGDIVNWTLGKPWVDPGLQIVDNYYSEVQLQVAPYTKITGTVDVFMAGFYTLKYVVTDPSGNVSNEVTRRVRILVNSVNDVKSSNGITLYPVPSNGEMNVVIDPALIAANETLEVAVYNIMGQKMNASVSSTTANKLTITMDGAASGNYYVKISGANINYSQKISVIK